MSISSEIKRIVDKRVGNGEYKDSSRLALIEGQMKTTTEIESCINELIVLHEELKNDSSLLENSSSVLHTLNRLELGQFSFKLVNLRQDLMRLKERFGRSKIQIAFIGKARQGKSSFLQRITGLTDSTIPSSSGSDCTGAISIIENVSMPIGEDFFEAKVEYYSVVDFIAAVNNKLREFFPNSGLAISTLHDIPDLANKKEFQNIPSDKTKIKNFYDVYVKKFNIYQSLIGKCDETFNKEEKVAEYVAKYKRFDKNDSLVTKYRSEGYSFQEVEDKTTIFFCKYVAVRIVHIKKTFRIPDAGDIVLVDTIGLGNKDTEIEDEKKMFEVLRNESDAAIFVYKPNEDGDSETPADQIEILNKIAVNLEGYSPEKWIVGAINKKSEGKCSKTGGEYGEYLEHLKQQQSTIAGQKQCIAWCEVVDGFDEEEVKNKLVLPLLNTIISNIDDIDTSFMKEVNEKSEKIYKEFYSIYMNLGDVIGDMVISSTGKKEIIDKKIDELPLKPLLHSYVSECSEQINNPCQQIVDDLRPTVDKITDYIPSKSSIVTMINNGPHWISGIYNEVMDDVRSKILAEMKDVSAQSVRELQKKIKEDIAWLLFHKGLLGEIKLKSASSDTPTVGWMRAFSHEKLVKYPVLQSAFNTVSNFEMRIEGYLYSKCICACDQLRPNKTTPPTVPENLTAEGKANIIWQSIFNVVLDVQALLYKELGLKKKSILQGSGSTTEAIQPNIILWCVADTFEQEIRHGDGAKELGNLYYEYGQSLWYDEIIRASNVSKMQERWISLYGILNSLCDKNRLQLTIK